MNGRSTRIHRMPIFFGPAYGPRRSPASIHIDESTTHRRTNLSCVYTCDGKRLERLLPGGFALRGESVLEVEMGYIDDVEWLAGRGYNLLSVKVPVHYRHGATLDAGHLSLVLWENLADAVLTGREELGYSKLHADIPPLRRFKGRLHGSAEWQGFRFFSIELGELRQEAEEVISGTSESSGTFHVKYIPRTGDLARPDICYVTKTPKENRPFQVLERYSAAGRFRFMRATWEDMPTMFHIVNTLSRIKLGEFRGAMLTISRGTKNLSDQQVIAEMRPPLSRR